ncbi:MAG: hypothetical protein RL272_494 [Candidatus Parcubacteria bacterium]|jgi:type IV pilus assembly protein PilC
MTKTTKKGAPVTGRPRPARIRSKEKEYFVENFATLISSGTGITAALSAIRAEIRSEPMRKVVEGVREDIDAGSPVWKALEKTRILPDYFISLIRVGEESGRLPENLATVAAQQEKDRVFRSRMRSAMIYPLFVLSVTVVVGIGISWFILPRLSSVFGALRMELPLITKIVIGFGTFLKNYGYVAVPAFIAAATAAVYLLFVKRTTKFVGQAMLFSFPPIRRLLIESELARLGYLLGSLLRAGIPIVAALESVKSATELRPYARLYGRLAEGIDDGDSFQKVFARTPKVSAIVPIPVQQMIVSAEQSGHLADVFLRIGLMFEEKTETSAKNLAVVLEPILLVIVWIGVAVVAFSVVLPIYSLIGGLQH